MYYHIIHILLLPCPCSVFLDSPQLTIQTFEKTNSNIEFWYRSTFCFAIRSAGYWAKLRTKWSTRNDLREKSRFAKRMMNL